jgi:hypothetical protein
MSTRPAGSWRIALNNGRCSPGRSKRTRPPFPKDDTRAPFASNCASPTSDSPSPPKSAARTIPPPGSRTMPVPAEGCPLRQDSCRLT